MANVISENIVNLVKDQIGDQMLEQIKGVLGSDGPKASTALGSFLPALLSGVTNLAGSSKGADTLFNAVGKQDDGMLDNVGALLREGQGASVVDQGSNLLGTLFGSNGADKLGNVLSAFTGVSRGGTNSLMGIVAPLVIGVIKRKFMGGVSSPSGLSGLLQSQKPHINAAMPVGLSDQLQASGFLGSIDTPSTESVVQATGEVRQATGEVHRAAGEVHRPASSVQHTSSTEVQSGFNWKKYLLPIAGLLILGWGALQFFGGSTDDVAETATGAATSATEAATDVASDAVGSVDIDAVGTQLTDMFGGATDTLTGITDAASAEAAVPALEGVSENLSGLTGMIEQIPEAARGPLSSIISNGVAALQPLVETASAIPGVGAIIEPIVGPLMETLNGLAG